MNNILKGIIAIVLLIIFAACAFHIGIQYGAYWVSTGKMKCNTNSNSSYIDCTIIKGTE